MKNDQKPRWNCKSVCCILCIIELCAPHIFFLSLCPFRFLIFIFSLDTRIRTVYVVAGGGCLPQRIIFYWMLTYPKRKLFICYHWNTTAFGLHTVRIHLFQFGLCVCAGWLSVQHGNCGKRVSPPKTMLKLKRWHTNAFVSLIHSQHNHQNTQEHSKHEDMDGLCGVGDKGKIHDSNNSTPTTHNNSKKKTLFGVVFGMSQKYVSLLLLLSIYTNAHTHTHHRYIRQSEKFHNEKYFFSTSAVCTNPVVS